MLRRIWIAAGVALAACGGAQQQTKKSEPVPPSAVGSPHPVESPASVAPPAPAAPPSLEATCEDLGALDTAAKATPVIEGLPYWCYQYKESLRVLVACEGTPPEAKSQIKEGLESLMTSLGAVTSAEGKEEIQRTCRTALEAICPASVTLGCGVLPPRR